uniref:Uncharacterized protein n=1 Tax=Ciona intestinalis TaxID=7719 RepID=H2XY66_CIOIN
KQPTKTEKVFHIAGGTSCVNLKQFQTYHYQLIIVCLVSFSWAPCVGNKTDKIRTKSLLKRGHDSF